MYMLLSFILCNFLVRILRYFLKNLKGFFAHKELKKPSQKVAYLWQLRENANFLILNTKNMLT